MTGAGPVEPLSTYRLQLNRDFSFARVEELAPYLAELGISHAYLSPILKARPESTHGYDVVDFSEINPELGTLDDFRRLAGVLRSHGIGIILDFVPNHMGVGGAANRLWLDVLEWGDASPSARWFDINWRPPAPDLAGKLLVPFLGRSYWEALSQGDIELRFDAGSGSFAVWAHDAHKLPLSPLTYARILQDVPPAGNLARAFERSTPSTAPQLKANLAELCAGSAAAANSLHAKVRGLNADRSGLHALILRQNWRLASHRVAHDDINYRRFFVVSDLAGIRIEDEVVFDAAHQLIFRLIGEGLVQGLRIDHVDGLADPKGYCLALRRKAPAPIYLIVEKILAQHEVLRTDWELDGTTGYEFSSLVTPLLTDPSAEEPLTRIYEDFVGGMPAPDDIEHRTKLRIMGNELSAELESLSHRLAALARSNVATADVTRNALKRALREYIAELPVYRTYVGREAADGIDRRNIGYAITRARRFGPSIDPAAFDFLERLLLGELGVPGSGYVGEAARDAVTRIQQFTGPVMAKGLEDTALYRYNRLVALNEVGERPDRFSTSIDSFHDANRARLERTPRGMITSSSHDTKRGEDTRARLAAISGDTAGWEAFVDAASSIMRSVGAPQIERNDEYLFYQLLLGAWPAELSPTDANGLDVLRQRLQVVMEKSIREERGRTEWTLPDEAYEEAVRGFIDMALTPRRAHTLLEVFTAAERRFGPWGAQNGLIQTVLKLTVPGVPDIYQGAELWEQSMVDPDNRRPVDFGRRGALLTCVGSAGELHSRMESWRSGEIKLGIIARLLKLRREEAGLFTEGSYEPLELEGPDADRVVAFSRRHGRLTMVVLAGLRPWRGPAQSRLALETGSPAAWKNLLGGGAAHAGSLELGPLLEALPVAVLLQRS